MSLILYLILLAIEGLIVGAFARLALPGKDPMTIPQTIGVGLAGSFIGGMIVYVISGTAGGGFLVSLVFATLIVYFVRRRRGGGLTQPGGPGRDGSTLR